MNILKPKRAILVLEDGTEYYGWSFSSPMSSKGEIVFNTGITGYQEIITDPSYLEQIVTFTYPEIGNTGMNKQDNESIKPYVKGIILKSFSKKPSNWRSNESLIDYLIKYNIIHIYGIDTRALTRHIRKSGTITGCISTENLNNKEIYKQLQIIHQTTIEDYVNVVSTTKSYTWQRYQDIKYIYRNQYNNFPVKNKDLRIIIIDFGVKSNILHELFFHIKNLIILPANSKHTTILAYKPDGILLSNGPGNPETILYAIKTVQHLLSYKIPIFGICMGHQIISLALGLEVFKLKFGHRGLNHPVGFNKNIKITSQNHGFAVKNNIYQDKKIALIQLNYNDQTIAGFSHRKYPYFSVQYHPESSPGPNDSKYLFLHFIRIVQIIKNLQ